MSLFCGPDVPLFRSRTHTQPSKTNILNLPNTFSLTTCVNLLVDLLLMRALGLEGLVGHGQHHYETENDNIQH